METRKIARKTVNGLTAFGDFIICILRLRLFEDLKNYFINKERNKPLAVLANGPSLNNSLECLILSNEYKALDFATVNFMPNDDRFYLLKPKYHVISDPMFYNNDSQKERVELMFSNLNKKVDWNLVMYVAYNFWKDKKWCKKIENSNIQLLPLHIPNPPQNKRLTMFLVKRGLMGADFGSVLHHAINIGLMSGYNKLFLYGADHTFFEGLCVDNENRVCKITKHFYDNNEEVKPIYYYWTGQQVPYTMSWFLYEYMRVFRGHEILRMVADEIGVEIINKTPISMIDSYKRA